MDKALFSPERMPALSEHDQAMLEQLLLGLTGSVRMHVVLSSLSGSTVDHCRQLLVDRLRQSGVARIESFVSSNTEQLVSRFNALVAALPLEQALQRSTDAAATAQAKVTVFVVHDSAQVQLHDVRLLARLARDFPGAHVRVLLACDTEVDTAERIQALGHNQVLHWAIEPFALRPHEPFAEKPGLAGQPAGDTAHSEAAAPRPGPAGLDAWGPLKRLMPGRAPPAAEVAGEVPPRSPVGPSQRALRRAAMGFLLGMIALYALVALGTAWQGRGSGAPASPAQVPVKNALAPTAPFSQPGSQPRAATP
jgi:hypothetical protein